MTFVTLNNRKNGLTTYSPFNELIDGIFNNNLSNNRPFQQTPAVNISETETDFKLALASPGLKKEDFKLNLEKNVLSVSAETKTETNNETEKISRKEFSYNSFSRSFTLPQTADFNHIEASYEDGILKITVAKKEEAKIQSREIAIN
ncbi:MAG: Hsp20/alpha crystallin family protein [Sphingobacteriales bacterium]|nr:MAG: Hsp20/alpha crystallin family protein [Sphingobacteriales bacterium]TAF83752.1 MAG: Hsp20/alpha crystallin family protein [Sphingobacteriales bacterium]